MSVVPKGKSDWQAAKPNFTPAKRELPDYSKHDQVLAERPVKDDFDRSVQPKAADAVSVKVPAIWHGKLDKGIEIIGTRATKFPPSPSWWRCRAACGPRARVNWGWPASRQHDGTGLGAPDRGPAQRRAAKARFQRQRLQRQYNNLVTISSLTDKLPQTLALVREVFERPGMREADFERVKAQMLQGMKQSEQQPEWLAGQAFRELVYGKQNRLGQPGDGVLADVEKLTLADVKRFYQNYYNPTNAKVVVVGDVTRPRWRINSPS